MHILIWRRYIDIRIRRIKKIIDKHWYILKSDPPLSDIFEKTPRFVYKRYPNTGDHLVRADVSLPERPTHFLSISSGNYSGGRCAQCNFTIKTNVFSHPHSGREFKIKGVITCTTKNVIYMIKCPCGLAYIGKTQRALKTGIAEHLSCIRTNNLKNPGAVHFNSKRHNLSTLRYIGIEHVKVPGRGGDVNNILLKREAYYIYTLNTLSPKGLNLELDFNSCF